MEANFEWLCKCVGMGILKMISFNLILNYKPCLFFIRIFAKIRVPNGCFREKYAKMRYC